MFQVVWVERAVNELAELWVQADSDGRRSITEAADTMDKILETKPFESSESREEGLRVMFVPPLGVFFEVDLSSETVKVAHVWRYRGPRT